ncbi:PRR15 protein, partial [Formicarius rufipectus]|nr:PRR15 protein [Formicarius rufipectus]
MADSAAATAAPRTAVKGGSAGSWWKSLSGKKKHKDATAAPPPPTASETSFDPASPASPDGREEQPPPFGSGDTAGTGVGNRRSLRVSHSGRFKERRKVRTSLLGDSPEVFDGGGAAGRAAQGSE